MTYLGINVALENISDEMTRLDESQNFHSRVNITYTKRRKKIQQKHF